MKAGGVNYRDFLPAAFRTTRRQTPYSFRQRGKRGRCQKRIANGLLPQYLPARPHRHIHSPSSNPNSNSPAFRP
jgi:hypothetical protein